MPRIVTLRNRFSRHDSQAGFSLIELAVVMVVLGILAAIAIPSFLSQQSKAYGSGAVTDLRNAATAETAQLADYGAYSTSTSALAGEGFQPSASTRFGIAVTATGYCEAALAGGKYWWYDSKIGVVTTPTTTLQPPTAAFGSCASAAPSSVS